MGYEPEEAADLTQAYFLRLLEKDYLSEVREEDGRFRSFLLASLKHFLANEWDKSQAQKRGGGNTLISLDTERAERRYLMEPADELTPEKLYERQWAKRVLKRVYDRLVLEFMKAGKSEHLEQFKPYLMGEEPQLPYKLAAEELGTSEGAIKTGVHRLRRRFGQVLRDEVADTVTSEDEVEEEIRYLFTAVSYS
jgi:RNA polymerase sigma-70 factor (ECF subfamily)